MNYFFLLVPSLYLAWFCLGRLSRLRVGKPGTASPAYLGVVAGAVALVLPVPWRALHTLLPAVSAGSLLLGLALLFGGLLYPLLAWLLTRYSVPSLQRGLIWTADASVLGWLLYGWVYPK